MVLQVHAAQVEDKDDFPHCLVFREESRKGEGGLEVGNVFILVFKECSMTQLVYGRLICGGCRCAFFFIYIFFLDALCDI